MSGSSIGWFIVSPLLRERRLLSAGRLSAPPTSARLTIARATGGQGAVAARLSRPRFLTIARRTAGLPTPRLSLSVRSGRFVLPPAPARLAIARATGGQAAVPARRSPRSRWLILPRLSFSTRPGWFGLPRPIAPRTAARTRRFILPRLPFSPRSRRFGLPLASARPAIARAAAWRAGVLRRRPRRAVVVWMSIALRLAPRSIAARFSRPGFLSVARWLVAPGSIAAGPAEALRRGTWRPTRGFVLPRFSLGPWSGRLGLPRPVATRRPARRFIRPGSIARWRATELVALRAHLAPLAPLRFLVELRARIFVVAARPPILITPLPRHLRFLPRLALRLLRVPQPALREPFQLDVRIRAFELRERRQQLLPLARAERRRRVVDEDRPVRKARRHLCIVTGIGD
jgi:hypothetical protein